MAYVDIKSRITIDGNPPPGSTFVTDVDTALQRIYDGSTRAARAFDDWLSSHAGNIEITYSAGNAQTISAPGGSGHVEIDPAFFASNYYISTTGKAVQDTFESGLTHELGHALTGKTDNESFADLSGDNVKLVNKWYPQLGFDLQSSYEAYDNQGLLIHNKDYTQGEAIKNAIIDRGVYTSTDQSLTFDSGNIDLAASGVTGSSLIVGGSGNNTYGGTSSKDWIYGGGGNDTLSGGNGSDHLYGGDGKDILHGGAGIDYLYGDGDATDATSTGNDKLFGDAGNDFLYGGSGSDELHGGIGANRLEGGDGPDKLVSEGKNDVLNGGHGDDIIELTSVAATIEFGSGDGSDVVQFDRANGTYTLHPTDLNPSDIDVVGGGFDAYYVMNHSDIVKYPDGTWYQFLTIRDKATGDQITFLENGLNGALNIGPSSSALPIGYNKGYNAGDTQHPSDQGKLDAITFSDGTTWDQSEIWNHLSDKDLWAYATGDNTHGFGSGSHNETDYLTYVNQTYLQAFSEFVI